MTSVILGKFAAAEIGVNRQEEWAKDSRLFQPNEEEQILLPDNANCLAVQTFLKMCKLPFTVEYRKNAEFMSPSGKVPFIQCGAFIISELNPIISFVADKGYSLTKHMTEKQKSDMRAYMSLVNNILINAELFVTWVEPSVFKQITKHRYGSVFPWPLNHILTCMKRRSVIARLKALRWYQYKESSEKIFSEVDKLCKTLSVLLDKNHYFYGEPTELDALVFGHVHAILSTPLPDNRLADIIKSHVPLLAHWRLQGNLLPHLFN